MFNFGMLLVFIPAATALILAPGPDTIYVLTQAVEEGRRIGVTSAIGISTGVIVHTCAAIFGLSVILRESALVFKLVKYLGAAYLIYLGLTTLWSPQQLELDATYASASRDGKISFARGILVNVLNPKVALFFLAFFPQFVSSTGSTTLQLLVLGGTYSVLTLCYLTGIALFAGAIRHIFVTRPSVERILQRVTGTVLVGLGIQIALKEKLST